LILAQIQQIAAARAVLFDPHGSVAPAGTANVAVANHLAAMLELAGKLDAVLDSRLADYVAGVRDYAPLFVIVDEIPALARNAQAVIDVAGRCILEGRKVAIYVIVAGQGVPAALFGGSTARDSITLRAALATHRRQAEIIGFEGDVASHVAALNQRGLAYVDGPFPATLVAVPQVLEGDLLQRPRVLARVAASGAEAATQPLGVPEPLPVTVRNGSGTDKERVLACLRAGDSISATVQTVWSISKGGGRNYMARCNDVMSIVQELAATS